MFYEVVVNDWGETTYVPTTLGNICLAVIIVALLFGAACFIKKKSKKLEKPRKIKQNQTSVS